MNLLWRIAKLVYTSSLFRDKYTTKGGLLGFYGDTQIDQFKETIKRRFNIKSTPCMPELIRVDKRLDDTLEGKRSGNRFPWCNFTTCQQVIPHKSSKGWQGCAVTITNARNINPERFLFIEPMDTCITGGYIRPDVIISGKVSELNKAIELGFDTLSSKKLRNINKNWEKEIKDNKNNYNYNPYCSKYAYEYTKEIDRLITKRGIPTNQDYKFMAKQTGLPYPIFENKKVLYDKENVHVGNFRFDPSPYNEGLFRRKLKIDDWGKCLDECGNPIYINGELAKGKDIFTEKELQQLARSYRFITEYFIIKQMKIEHGY